VKLETREVLAGAYKGGRASLARMLTHYAVPGTDTALCGRLKPDALCDRAVAGPPTCPVCVKRGEAVR
jgi:hypothetical protein